MPSLKNGYWDHNPLFYSKIYAKQADVLFNILFILNNYERGVKNSNKGFS
jgi:hypothetical protein